MRANLKTLLGTAAIVAALAGWPSLYAYADTQNQSGSGGMMQGGQGGMMGHDGMMGMMNMMQEMSQMMETCNKMMQSMDDSDSGKPNEQWRKDAPESEKTPEKDG